MRLSENAVIQIEHTTIPERIRQLASERPGDIFCTFVARGKDEAITFTELLERSCAYARRFIDSGVKPGDLVLVILKHTPHLFYAYMGAMLAGAIPSYLPFPSPKQRADLYWEDHAVLFERIAPRMIVTYAENLIAAQDTLPGFSVPVLLAENGILECESHAELPGVDSSIDEIACLQHSSGTTSLKKGVMLTHSMIVDHLNAYNRAIQFTASDSIASWLPLYHDMGFVACFLGSLLSGTHLVSIDPFEWVVRPSILLDAIEEHRTTFCWLPNFAFSHLANTARSTERWDLSSVRAFINCSEPCKPKTFDRFLERFESCGVTREKLQVCYAMAENVFGVTQTRLSSVVQTGGSDDAAGMEMLSCGVPIPGVSVEIRDDDGDRVPDGCIGEIMVQGPFLFHGYYKLADKTAEKLCGGWYHTGDMGYLQDGQLFVSGRKDDMIIVAGRNYYAHEIESIVNTNSHIIPGRCVAIGVEDGRTDATVVVVLAECTDATSGESIANEVRREVLEKIGLAIHSLIPLTKGRLVKTTSGKISRSKNKELYINGALSA